MYTTRLHLRRLGYINREWISKNSERAETNMVRKQDEDGNPRKKERHIEMWGDERKERRRGSLNAGSAQPMCRDRQSGERGWVCNADGRLWRQDIVGDFWTANNARSKSRRKPMRVNVAGGLWTIPSACEGPGNGVF